MSKKSSVVAPVITDADNNNENSYDQPTYDLLVKSATKARKSKSNDPLRRLDVSCILTHNKNQEPGWIRRIIPHTSYPNKTLSKTEGPIFEDYLLIFSKLGFENWNKSLACSFGMGGKAQREIINEYYNNTFEAPQQKKVQDSPPICAARPTKKSVNCGGLQCSVFNSQYPTSTIKRGILFQDARKRATTPDDGGHYR
jgi:hypothetical protein